MPKFRTFALFLASALSLSAAELQVFAAASLTDALKEIAPAYEAASGNTLQFNFAGSQALSRQIREGAPADVFLSADEAKMDALEKAGLILDGARTSLLSNSLVVVVAVDSTLVVRAPKDLAGPEIKRLALADPRGVPAGVYAKAYLEKIGFWEAVKDRVVPCENVRAALASVESGDAEAGIVYKTDSAVSKAVKVAWEVPVTEGPKISYPMAVIKGSKYSAEAEMFFMYLASEPALSIFQKHGFLVQP
jgi:molybdate transport system substrate-binding protein